VLAQKITAITESLKICYVFNINDIGCNIVHRLTEMTHQQRVSWFSGCTLLNVLSVGELRQSPLLAFVLEEDILLTCCNKNDVM